MPKKYTMVDSSGQRHTNVYDEDMPEFMEMFPGAYILETFEDDDLVTQQDTEKQLDLMNQPTDYESVLKSELSEYDNVNKQLEVQYDSWFNSMQERDKWTQSLSPEEQQHVKNREFDKLSKETKDSLSIVGLTGRAEPKRDAKGNITFIDTDPEFTEAIQEQSLIIPRLSKMSKVERDEYLGSTDSYREDLNNYLETRDKEKIPTDFLDSKMGSAVIGNEEEKVVPTMIKLYNPYGFTFEETGAGDAMIVRTKDGKKEIEIDLDNWTDRGDREEALKLKNFLDTNQTEFSPIINERKYIDDLAYNMYQSLDKAAKIKQDDWALTKVDRDIDGETVTLWDNDYREDIVKNQTASLNNQIIDLNKNVSLLEAEKNTLAYNQTKLQEDIDNGLPQDQIDIRIQELKEEAIRLQENSTGYQELYEKEILPLQGALNIIQGKNYVIQAEKGDIGSHTLNFFAGMTDSFSNIGKAIALGIEELELESQGIDKSIIQEKMDERLKGLDTEIKFTDVSNEYAQEFDSSILGGVYRAGVEMIGMIGASALTGPAAPYTYAALMGANIAGNVIDEMNEMEGVSNLDKLKLAGTIGVVNGALEAVGAKYLKVFKPLTGGKTLTGGVQKLIMNAFGKVPKGAMTKAALQKATIEALEEGLKSGALKITSRGIIEGVVAEGVTEVSQTISETGFKALYNELKGEEKFENLAQQVTLNNLAKTFTIGGITGGLFGGLSGARNAYRTKTVDRLSNQQFMFIKELMKNKSLHTSYSAKLQTEINNPKSKFSKEQAQKALRDLNEMGGLYNQVSNLGLTTEGEKRAFTLLQKKQALQKQLDTLGDKALGKRQREEITAIDQQLEDISLTYNFETQYQRGIQKAKDIAEASGKGFQIIEDADAFEAKMKELGVDDDKGFRSTPGYIHTDGNIYINDAIARDLKQIGVGQHELLHGITGKQLQGITGEAKTKLIEDFKSNLSKKELDAIMPRIESEYGGAEGVTAEEFFNVFAEAIVDGDIKYNENVFTKIGDWVTNNVLRPLGFAQASFKDGKAVYRFMKDYGKQGRRIALGLQEDYEGDVGRIVQEGTAAPAIPMMSRRDLTDLAKSYKSDPAAADIEQLLQQYRNVAFKALGFDRAKGDIPSSEAQSFVDAEFMNILDRYDGSTEFSTWVTSNIRPKRQQFYQEQIGDTAESLDKQEARQIADEGPKRREVSEKQARQESRKIKVAKRLGVEEQIKKEVDKKVKDLDVTKLNYKKLKNLATETVGELFGISPKKLTSNANLTKGEVANAQRFIAKNVDLLMSLLPEGYSSDFTSSGVPKVLLENFYNQRSVRAKTGPGLKVQIKKPDIKTNEFLEVFGFVDGKPTRDDRNISSRILALANQTGKMMTNQAVREQAILEGVDPAKLQTLSSPIPQGFFSKKSNKNQGRTFDEILNDIYGIENIDSQRKAQLLGEALRVKLDENPEETIRDIIKAVADGLQIKEGFAYEQVLYDVINDAVNQYNIPGLELSAGPTEVGGAADIVLTYYGQTIGIEAKKGNARFGSVTASYDQDGELITKKNYTFDKILKQILKKAKPEIDAYIKEANVIGKRLFPDTYIPIKYITEAIPQEIYNELQNRGFQKAITQTMKVNTEFVSELYWAKANGTAYIQIQGLGTYYLTDPSGVNTENPLNLDVPAFTGDLELAFATSSNSANNPRSYSNDILVDGKKDGSKALPGSTGFRRISLRFQPSKITGLEKSSLQLDQPASIAKAFSQADLNNKITKEQNPALAANENLEPKGFKSKRTNQKDIINNFKVTDQAITNGNKIDQPPRKIRVFDFDDTLATSNNLVFATKDGETIQLNAEEFAKQGDKLLADGYEFDFTDFNTVRDGGEGPLLKLAKRIRDARGNEDIFVLTARAPEAQGAIYEFLKSQDLELKPENIVGLGDSTGAAKAQWMISKYAEGYNDFYFADDAYQNVYAVQEAFNVLDIKGRVQQAKADQGFRSVRDVNKEFNDIIEQTKGVKSDVVFSDVRAKLAGKKNDKFKFWIPYSAEDLLGLVYPLLGKGKQGDAQMKWFKEMLFTPLAKANEAISASRLQMMEDFKALKNVLNVPKDITKENETGFTTEQTIRMYIWNSLGVDIPGVSKSELNKAIEYVASRDKLKTFAEQLLSVTKGDGWAKPSRDWFAGTIQTDLLDVLNTTKRAKYMQEFNDNAEIIFSKENLNKLEAIYGSKYREAVENMLKRIKTGKNRLTGGNRLSDRVLNYINGSIGAIMFFNMRSAVLQTISSINFINWNDNNPLAAGKAFANQSQYWKDFKTLMNSDFLKDRRQGLRLNINENEIADLARTAKNKGKAAISYLLRKGYLPTQFADSFAIASGGATFYRNRINTYLKEGLSTKEAEQKAMRDFREIAEESQQSSRPDKISQQQSSDLGRILLAFANTPMQYGRLTKRAYQDLIAGRGDAKSNISKIIYYTFVQNMIFNALQQAVFALGFGDEEDDEKKEEKYLDTANGMADSILRGLGIAGQAVSVGKNFLLDIYERSGRSRPEYVDSVYKLLQFSPPISSKISKIRQAAWQFDSKKRRQDMIDKGLSLDNPAYEAAAKVITAATNAPLDRLYLKLDNIQAALAEDTEVWQTIALLAGWPEWQIKPKEKSKTKKTKKKKFGTSSTKGGYKSTGFDTKKKTKSKSKRKRSTAKF